jgi:hypothetical protein
LAYWGSCAIVVAANVLLDVYLLARLYGHVREEGLRPVAPIFLAAAVLASVGFVLILPFLRRNSETPGTYIVLAACVLLWLCAAGPLSYLLGL